MKQKYILFALFVVISFKGISQSNYVVTTIPFQQYTGALTAASSTDDTMSPLISLPFPFDFYGVTYNQVTISTNGYIDFRTSSASGYSPWNFNLPIPNPSFQVLNSILGNYQDMNNSNAEGTITYGSYGTAPNRKFVVYFNNNSLFSCTTSHASFQMILSETSNNIDVQLIDKPTCPGWNGGNSVSGLINANGTFGITPPERNTGSWTAYHEGWRYYRAGYYPNYSFVICDDNSDGIGLFNLTVAQNDLSPANPSAISFYETATDAAAEANPMPTSYYNITAPQQTIYARGNGVIRPVTLSVIDCSIDTDLDTVATTDEDVNGDTNLANDDTDFDGLPNYLDNDDDGDLVLTSVEYVFSRNSQSANSILDTDGDSIPNYLDNDDDGDNLLTFLEDYNGNGTPSDDDTNTNGTPDYLEMAVALGIDNHTINISNKITLYPNPTSNVLYIDNKTGDANSNITIYAVNGGLVKQMKTTQSLTSIGVSDLQTGVYFVKIELNNQVLNYKFIKN